MSAVAAGIAWYSPEAWQQLVAMPEARIENSYSDFVRIFENAVREFAAQGVRAEKISINVGEMIAWCHSHGYEIDAKGRAVYGSIAMLGATHAPLVIKTRVVQ
jgi:hypothetical protein